MAIVGGKAVREEQANGLICCVNKRMLVTAQQWHISVALRRERGLERESAIPSCLTLISVEKTLRGWQKNVYRKQNNKSNNRSLSFTTFILYPSWRNAANKGGHSSRHLYGSHFVVFPLFLPRQRVKTSFFFISNNTWADTSPLHTFLCYLHCVVRPLKQ